MLEKTWNEISLKLYSYVVRCWWQKLDDFAFFYSLCLHSRQSGSPPFNHRFSVCPYSVPLHWQPLLEEVFHHGVIRNFKLPTLPTGPCAGDERVSEEDVRSCRALRSSSCHSCLIHLWKRPSHEHTQRRWGQTQRNKKKLFFLFNEKNREAEKQKSCKRTFFASK